jgi:hypothetical protein
VLPAAKGAEVSNAFAWLRQFDADDLSSMTEEIVDAVSAAAFNNEWENVS